MTENDKQIADLSKKQHRMKRELACLKDQWKQVGNTLSEVGRIFREDEGWTMVRYDPAIETIHISIPKEDHRDITTYSTKDMSLRDVAKMGQRIVQLTEEIADTKRQLLECLEKEWGEGDD